MGWYEYEELFNRLGLGPLAKQFWRAIEAGDRAAAERIFVQLEAKLAEKGALRAAAGTLARMRSAVAALMEAAEVAPAVIGESTILSQELLGTLAAGEAEALPEELAAGPPGWAVAAITLLILLALVAIAKADEKPPKQERPPRNPFDGLPPELRSNPKFNPAAKLNQQTHPKLEEYKKQKHKKCTCYGGAPRLGGNIAGQALALSTPMQQPMLCTWPDCPRQRAS